MSVTGWFDNILNISLFDAATVIVRFWQVADIRQHEKSISLYRLFKVLNFQRLHRQHPIHFGHSDVYIHSETELKLISAGLAIAKLRWSVDLGLIVFCIKQDLALMFLERTVR